MSDRMTRAVDGWKDVPDWVELLVAACDAKGSSQGKVAKKLGRTPSVISQVLSNTYKGDMSDIEDRVRSVLDAQQVNCPPNGWISSADCLAWRDEARTFFTRPPHMLRMFKACRSCPIFQKTEEASE